MNKLLETITLRFAQNVGIVDRVVRGAFSVSILVLYVCGLINGWVFAGLGILAVMIFLTSVTGKCSIYHLTGLSSRRVPRGE
ncbi:MAG: DUF2892 domain-containing protein [Leptospirales bacterium]|nr:DUF2892 domain-containing protein [Leptospirales bacterium]